jgi:lipoprotein-anchoring transpeptidase ErfK/SrfK
VPAGGGIYGQLDRQETFNIGRAQVLKVNTRTDQLKVLRAGKLVKQIPITTGAQPEFTTRSGVKVIIEKDRRHDMNSETIGIDPNGPNGYNLKGVEFAMRLTYSGEFLHAAPWSVGSQGRENVSHGCTGMSTANADWLYNNTLVGDPVEYTGTNRMMTLTNGYGDWNVSFDEYQKGSAL